MTKAMSGRPPVTYCTRCGAALEDPSAPFCGSCGAAVNALLPKAGSTAKAPAFTPSAGSGPNPSRRVVLLVAIALVAVVAGVFLQRKLTGDGGSSSEAQGLSTSEIADIVGCTGACQVEGKVDFDHPSWGGSVFVAASDGDTMELSVVGGDGTVEWEESGLRWYLVGTQPEVDDLEHVFVEYTSGAGGTSGVIVLAPAPDDMEDFGSLPTDDLTPGRFFGQGGDGVEDTDGDGVDEILVGANDCVPDCASGTVTNTEFRWDGEDYVSPVIEGD